MFLLIEFTDVCLKWRIIYLLKCLINWANFEFVFSHFINPSAPANDPTCHDGGTYNAPHILIFMLAMVLIGCGGTPIFTLGTTYIDDHVKKESSSMYIGMYCCIYYSMIIDAVLFLKVTHYLFIVNIIN